MKEFTDFMSAALPWICMGLLLAIFFAQSARKKKNDSKEENKKENYGTEGMALGMCFGVAIGTALGFNNGIGLTLGLLQDLRIAHTVSETDMVAGWRRWLAYDAGFRGE